MVALQGRPKPSPQEVRMPISDFVLEQGGPFEVADANMPARSAQRWAGKELSCHTVVLVKRPGDTFACIKAGDLGDPRLLTADELSGPLGEVSILKPALVMEREASLTRDLLAALDRPGGPPVVLVEGGRVVAVFERRPSVIPARALTTRISYQLVDPQTTVGGAMAIMATELGGNSQNLFLILAAKDEVRATSVRVVALASRRFPAETPLLSLPGVLILPTCEYDTMRVQDAARLAGQGPSRLLAVLKEGRVLGLIESEAGKGSVARGRGDDFFAGSALTELYGGYVTSEADGWGDIQPGARPTCPHCQARVHFEYRVRTDEFYCPECKETIDI
jgi:hypothetical protein